MSVSNIFVTNQRSAYKPVPGAASLNKAISSTTIVGSTDSALALDEKTEVLLVQVNSNDVWLNLHGETPSATTSLVLVSGTILEMSRSQWLAAKWKRVSADATIVAQQ